MNLDKLINTIASIDRQKLTQLEEILKRYDKIILIGNGGSNAIASHIAVDYTKFLKKRAMAFTNTSMVTCYMNDSGVENAYSEYIKNFADEETLVVLISSSGNSENICNSALLCKNSGISYILLTGFSYENKVRSLYSESALLDLWVDSNSYAIVECVHMVCLHAMVDV
mgnify:CR=1 FL=1|tara:strand:+ start:1120 stop:1626 length:507 start_codon:yes stop_codon:yes gene_type:complete